MTDISYSYSQTTPQPAAQQPPEDLWSFCQINTLQGPSGTVVLHNPRSDARMVITADVAQALTLCRPFRTLGEHAVVIGQAMPALKGQEAGVVQTLKSIADAGLLHSARKTLQDLKQTTTQSAQSAPVDTPIRLFILTCDRPTALSRLIASIQAKPLPASVEGLWVIDDSRDAANEVENQRIVAGATGDLPVTHIGTQRRDALIEHLETHHPDLSSSIRFALDRDRWPGQATHGVARNIAQLLSVGCRAIVFDDDMLCEAVAPPMASKPLRFSNIAEREAQLYRSADELNRYKMVLDNSPVELMARSLGSAFNQLAKTHEGQLDPRSLAGIDGDWVLRYTHKSQVLLAQTGCWGDPGTGSGNWLFFLPKASIKKLVESGEDLETVIAARASWVGFRGPTLTPYGAMSGMTGLDNRELLPPYLPASRSEDILFAIMLQRIHPRSMVMNTEWSVPHVPVDSRASRADLAPIKAEPSMTNLVDWLGREPKDQWGVAPERLMSGLADQLRRLAEMAPEELNRLVSQEVLSKQSNLLGKTSDLLRDLPTMTDSTNKARWQEFLEATRDGLVKALQTVNPSPLDQVKGPSGHHDLNELALLGREFADLLDAWPALREAARDFCL